MNKTTFENFLTPLSGRLGFLLLFLLHVVASYYYISQQDITYDEPQYIEYAKRWLHGRPERIELMDDSKSPVVAICWIPRIVRQIINPHYHLTDFGYKDQKEGRYMMILFSFLAALYVYWWCRELYGSKGWMMPLLLLLFDPLYLAYSTIITTDLACGAVLVALLYHYRKYLITRQRKQFYVAAVYSGIAIVTKQNMLFVLFFLPLLSVLFTSGEKKKIILFSRQRLIDIVLFSFTILLIINLFYYFKDTFIPFGEYKFGSSFLQNVQSKMQVLHSLPVPFPKAYVQSIDMVVEHSEIGSGKPGSTYNGVYLFGELSDAGGFWYYYLVMCWYKMPIGTILLVVSSMLLFCVKFRLSSFLKHYAFLVVPIIFYAIFLSFFNKFQIGIRHLLVGFPLLYIGLGKLFFDLRTARWKYKALTALAVGYIFISVASFYPYIIPYTNEFIANKKMVYRKILDSSVDYGQSDKSIPDFIKENPGYKKASAVPDTGKYIVLMDHLIHSYLRQNNPYNWYQKLEPKGVYKYVILLYDIKEEDLVKAGF